MKAAFHFDAGINRFGNPYGERVENLVFAALLELPFLSVFSKIYVGDLMLHLAANDAEDFGKFATNWVNSAQNGWNKLDKKVESLFQTDVFIVCFDAIDKTTANTLHERLSKNPGYLTAIEINDASKLHWQFYSDALALRCRLSGKTISVLSDAFCDPLTDEEKDGIQRRFSGIGFPVLGFASSQGKHSIFDKYHDFDHARRIAEWRDKFGEMLGFVADNVITLRIKRQNPTKRPAVVNGFAFVLSCFCHD